MCFAVTYAHHDKNPPRQNLARKNPSHDRSHDKNKEIMTDPTTKSTTTKFWHGVLFGKGFPGLCYACQGLCYACTWPCHAHIIRIGVHWATSCVRRWAASCSHTVASFMRKARVCMHVAASRKCKVTFCTRGGFLMEANVWVGERRYAQGKVTQA